MSERSSNKRKALGNPKCNLQKRCKFGNPEVEEASQSDESEKGTHMERNKKNSSFSKANGLDSKDSRSMSAKVTRRKSMKPPSSNSSADEQQNLSAGDRPSNTRCVFAKSKGPQRASRTRNSGREIPVPEGRKVQKSPLPGLSSKSPHPAGTQWQDTQEEESANKSSTSDAHGFDAILSEDSTEDELTDSESKELPLTNRSREEITKTASATSDEEGTETSTSDSASDSFEGEQPADPARDHGYQRRPLKSPESSPSSYSGKSLQASESSSSSFSSDWSSDSSASPRPSPPAIVELLAHPPKSRSNHLPPSTMNLSQRLASFLPQLQRANAALTTDGVEQLDNVDEGEERYIEMSLGLGVLEEGKGQKQRRSMDGIQLEAESDSNSISSDEEDAEQLSREGVLETMMGRKAASKKKEAIQEVT